VSIVEPELFGFLVAPLLMIKQCQVVQADSGMWMLRTYDLLKDLQRSFVQRFGFFVAPLPQYTP
jgi:hypothetical protein